MFTNTFAPHVGGVTRSVLTLRGALEARGHGVLVVAPGYGEHRHDEPGVLRVPSIPHLTGSDYALPLPMARHIRDEIEAFGPDIVHSHHPFLLGSTALRTAAGMGLPVVFTYHTRYDLYVEGMAAANRRMAGFVRNICTGYANLADVVITPSQSMRSLLEQQGVNAPITVVPTGIDLGRYGGGDRAAMRRRLGLGPDDFVVGHLGRLAVEKNLGFLADAVAQVLAQRPDARFILSGRGPMKTAITERLTAAGVAERAVMVEYDQPADVASFYAAMDVFAFASLTETQGLVLGEALAAGCPVVALDAPGAHDALVSGEGGVLLAPTTSARDFAAALLRHAAQSPQARAASRQSARQAAAAFSTDVMGARIEAIYRDLIQEGRAGARADLTLWEAMWREVATEFGLFENLLHAAGLTIWPDRENAAAGR